MEWLELLYARCTPTCLHSNVTSAMQCTGQIFYVKCCQPKQRTQLEQRMRQHVLHVVLNLKRIFLLENHYDTNQEIKSKQFISNLNDVDCRLLQDVRHRWMHGDPFTLSATFLPFIVSSKSRTVAIRSLVPDFILRCQHTALPHDTTSN